MRASTNFPQLVLQRAQEQPDKPAYRFFRGANRDVDQLGFGTLLREAAHVAHQLRDAGLAGARVLIACRSQRDFVIGFYACLLAGAVAVPTSLPRHRSQTERFRLIAADAQAAAIISDSDILLETDWQQTIAPRRMINLRVGTVAAARTETISWPLHAAPEAPAFLQYTSGSTGNPKGVVVTHANLVHNSAAICAAFGTSREAEIFTALPLFHDMGLIGGLLHPMYAGCTSGFLSPSEFVQFPERWLQIISDWRICTSGGPNFMYELAATAIDDADLADVDLSCWRLAACGAEPVRAATLEQFAARFAPYGLRRRTLYPCYGLAEATLFVSGGHLDDDTAAATSPVSCGLPQSGLTVRIVDPDRRRALPDGETGEIWIKGESVAAGYWQQPELSRATFQAQLIGADGAYLRTGDLGYLSDGQLRIAGRIKDLIICRGVKHVPDDIEALVGQSHAAVQAGACAAFNAATEDIVIVVELRRSWLRRSSEWPAIVGAIRTAVAQQGGIAVHEVVLLRPATLPRTSSGKIRRSQCRQDYRDGILVRALPTHGAAPLPLHPPQQACP